LKIFVDSSVFLKLLFNEPGADKAQEILESIESNKVIGYVTPLVLEEVVFKLLYGKASELLNTKNIWRIREALRYDEGIRRKCLETIREFYGYIDYMYTRGLRVEYVTYDDWRKSLEYMKKHGLLPADALHLAVASRIGVTTIATFDEDFKYVDNIKTIP